MLSTLTLWLACGAVVIAFLIIYKLIRHYGTDRLYKAHQAALSTPLNEFRESYSNDSRIARLSDQAPAASIGKTYEKMCLDEPLAHQGSPVINNVIESYRRLLAGEILDPGARHAPSEVRDDVVNQDYILYLKAQKKALKAANQDPSWFEKEYKRVVNVQKEEDMARDFRLRIHEMGMPKELVWVACSEHRIENYTPSDWSSLIRLIKKLRRDTEIEVLHDLLRLIDEREYLTEEKIEQFKLLHEYEVPEKLTVALVKSQINDEEFERMIYLMCEESYSPEEAIDKVLTDELNRALRGKLRAEYHAATHN